jgi:site-specific DNA-cytosine methylase
LLPTPTASDARDGAHVRKMTLDAIERGASRGVNLNHLVEGGLPEGGAPLLPTPRAARGASATETTEALLPTPTARDWKDGTPCENVPTNALLGRTVWGDFGPYTAAITRWSAVLGRQAPPPTEPGTNGRPRLSPRFVEFMMGLPDGWVCDVPGITRTAQLKMLGNGVVWQQALLALSLLDPS